MGNFQPGLSRLKKKCSNTRVILARTDTKIHRTNTDTGKYCSALFTFYFNKPRSHAKFNLG